MVKLPSSHNPLGSSSASISNLPPPSGLLPSSGQLQLGSPTTNGNYLIASNSLPIMGREFLPQVGNLSLSSQDSWSSGFTEAIQDNSRINRKPSSPLQSVLEVSQLSTSNNFQRLFSEARNYIEYTYSLIREFFDRSQIQALEESHRIIDSKIVRLAPFVSRSTESHNVYELIKALRVVQSRIEEKLISFFQNLNERDRMKVNFTLPQLRDHSYISVVNRSVHHKGNPSVTQFVNNSVNDRSISPNSSPIKNSSKNFANVKMSTPNKDENKVPEFSPPLEKNIIKDDSILQGANHKVRINARNDSSISLPQVNQVVIQNDRVNSRHGSGIDSPKVIQDKFISSVPSDSAVPLVSFALSIPSVSLVTSVSSVPVMSLVTSVPSVKSVSLVTSVPLAKSVSSVTSAQNEKTKIRSYAEVVSSNVAQNDSNNRYNAKTDNNNGISSRYLANFNIFLKRKNDVEVEVGKLLSSSKNNQIQPSTLKLRATDLKSKLTSLKIDKWVEDDKLGYFDPIELCNWEDRMDRDIASVLYQTEDLINVRKGLAQSGIKKRDPPKFSGSVLDYPLLKKNWSIEVSPGGLPELIELNLLKDSVPLTAKDRLYEVGRMVEAWDILNKIYGKQFD